VPRTQEANEALRQKSRDRILKAAVRLFSRRGFGGTTVRAIADEAGVALGLMYAHFESKEAVLAALMDASVLDVARTLDVAEKEPTARGFVAALLNAAVPLLDTHRDAWRLSYALRHQPEVLTSLAAPMKRFSAATLDRLRRALEARGVAHPEVEAAVLFALVDGISQQYVMVPRGYPIDAVIAAAARHYAPFDPPSSTTGSQS
jgi:AcrR family transcriptional regulator